MATLTDVLLLSIPLMLLCLLVGLGLTIAVLASEGRSTAIVRPSPTSRHRSISGMLSSKTSVRVAIARGDASTSRAA
ncbi:MAG: hypothetical protein R6X02_03695, partial [Enhygromyxa sp.]